MNQYIVSSGEAKIIADYLNMSVIDVDNLDIVAYRKFLRDAVIYNNMQTKEGRDWLDNAWILEQDKPDRKALRNRYGK